MLHATTSLCSSYTVNRVTALGDRRVGRFNAGSFGYDKGMASLLKLALSLVGPGIFMSIGLTSSEPPNVGAHVVLGKDKPTFEIVYEGQKVLSGKFSVDGNPDQWKKVQLKVDQEVGARGEITQRIVLAGTSTMKLHLDSKVEGSEQAFPAETNSPAQDRFKLVRNSVGLSRNLRNNAIYDRKRDWMLEAGTEPAIKPLSDSRSSRAFACSLSGKELHVTFRPRFYQKHKNLTYFRPWERDVWKGSITGWCSWWAYFDDIHEKDVERASQVFSDKLKDFGYTYIQIDDGYQGGPGGLPKDWLHTNDKFPRGLEHLSKSISSKGLDPALWLNVHFGDVDYVNSHLDWFITGRDGKAFKGPWIDYGLDGSVKAALDTIVRPTYQAIHKMGWKYVKVDALRHLLYDDSYPRREYFTAKGTTAEDAFRNYLKVIRQEVGADTYMLACWGVLPEVIGIADACRLGGDGFGPSTLQQYTSWNNVVWRNDPDHCDVKPFDRATGKYLDVEEKIRPVLVSMAGGQLLLSDKPEVYENDANLEGVKRSSPVMFTVPGQLYDFDPVKTDNLKKGLRNDQGGAHSGPIDADQRGEVCPWWMLDINQRFESWTVLTRMNWHTTAMPQQEVRFEELGLPDDTYSVFEFWSKKYLGEFHGSFTAGALDAKGVATYAIRKTLSRPQILSTSRHISQGGVDLVSVNWSANVLSGESKVVKNDPYSIFIRLPEGYTVQAASFGGHSAEVRVEDQIAEIKFLPEATGPVRWKLEFKMAKN